MYLYILLIIILVLLLCNQNKVREGFNVKRNIVEYKGSQYRTLSGRHPHNRSNSDCELGSYNPWGRGKLPGGPHRWGEGARGATFNEKWGRR